MKVVRNGQTCTGDAALALGKVNAVVDPNDGTVMVPESPAGIVHLIHRLKDAFEIHDQDKQGEILDEFWDTRRGSGSLQDFLLRFRQRYEEAESKAGLQLNDIGRTHLLFKWSGLPHRRIADIKLHHNGDLTQFSNIFSMISRIAKQEMAAGVSHHHGHYGEYEDVELNDDDYNLSFYTDEDQDEYIDFTYDEDTDLHYRDYLADTGEWKYGAYDSYWNWYEQDEVDTYLDELDLEEAYQMTGFRPKWRYGGFKREGKGKGRFRRNARGRGFKGRGRSGKGKGRDSGQHLTSDAMYGGKKGNGGKSKNRQNGDGCSMCGSKWHRDKDCPAKQRQMENGRDGDKTTGYTLTVHHVDDHQASSDYTGDDLANYTEKSQQGTGFYLDDDIHFDEHPRRCTGHGKGEKGEKGGKGKSSKSSSFRSGGRTPPWSTGFDSISEDSPSDGSWSVFHRRH